MENLTTNLNYISIQREGHTFVSQDFTQFKLGDKIAMVDFQENLEEVMATSTQKTFKDFQRIFYGNYLLAH